MANGCYIAAVNRTGIEEDTEFWGQSFVSDFYGKIVTRAPVSEEHILIADCDLKALDDMRRMWPFFRDHRIDKYDGVTSRMTDD